MLRDDGGGGGGDDDDDGMMSRLAADMSGSIHSFISHSFSKSLRQARRSKLRTCSSVLVHVLSSSL